MFFCPKCGTKQQDTVLHRNLHRDSCRTWSPFVAFRPQKARFSGHYDAIMPMISCMGKNMIHGIIIGVAFLVISTPALAWCFELSEYSAFSNGENATEPERTPEIAATVPKPSNPASDFEYNQWNGEITITQTKVREGDVTIPSQIKGLPVTSIGDKAFQYCGNLTSVTIPESVTTIEENVLVDVST